MVIQDCLFCQRSGVRSNGYFNYPCQCSFSDEIKIIAPQVEGTIIDGKVPNHDWLDKNNKGNKLYETVIKFMEDNDITCEETIHQCDWVIENAYEFIGKLFNIVKDDLEIEEG